MLMGKKNIYKHILIINVLLKGIFFSTVAYAETEIINVTAFDVEKESQDWQYIIEAETGYIGGGHSLIALSNKVLASSMINPYDRTYDFHVKWHSEATGRATIRLEDRQRGHTEEFDVQFTKTLYANNSTKYTNPNNTAEYHSPDYGDMTQYYFRVLSSENQDKVAGLYLGNISMPVIANGGNGQTAGHILLNFKLVVPLIMSFSAQNTALQLNESNDRYRASTRVDFSSNSPLPLEITAQLQCGHLVNNRCALTHDSNLDYWQYLVDINGQAISPNDKLKMILNPQDSFDLGVTAKMPYGKESGSYSGQFTVVFDAVW